MKNKREINYHNQKKSIKGLSFASYTIPAYAKIDLKDVGFGMIIPKKALRINMKKAKSIIYGGKHKKHSKESLYK